MASVYFGCRRIFTPCFAYVPLPLFLFLTGRPNRHSTGSPVRGVGRESPHAGGLSVTSVLSGVRWVFPLCFAYVRLVMLTVSPKQ